METSSVSQLPEFEAKLFHIDEPAGAYDMLEVRCPRKGCGEEFWVKRVWGQLREVSGRSDMPPAVPVGRNCPHCGRVSAIPTEYRLAPPSQLPINDRRRVVKRKKSKR